MNTQKKQDNHPVLSIVLPCYNEQEVIEVTHKAIDAAMDSANVQPIEIIYINDGSTDNTGVILSKIAQSDPRVTIVTLSRNFGHQPAVSAGLEYANGDAVVIMDADLQDPPEVVIEMLAKWREGYEVVYAVRENRKEGLLLRFGYSVFYRLMRLLSNVDIPLDSGDFSLIDRRVVDAINALPENNRFVRGLRSWVGFRQTSVHYPRAKRAAGTTKYPFWNLVKLALDGIINFSTVPLTLVSVAGLITALGSLAGFIFFFANKIFGSIFGLQFGENPGFTTLILTLLLVGGIQMFSIGLLGEYLGRIYQEVKSRPTYIVSQIYKQGRATPDATKK